MPLPYLTKTDFKAAFECASKLYYRRNHYPSIIQDNDYMKFLSDSGFMIEFIAKQQFPNGIDLSLERDPMQSFVRTREHLVASDDAVVFEGGFIHGKLYARADILRREGKTLHLIEVKSSSLRGNDEDEEDAKFLKKNGEVAAKWKPYLIDVAYQRHVLAQAFPEFDVKPWLWVVNQGQPVRECETRGLFHIEPSKTDPKARPEIRYSGSSHELQGTALLANCDVGRETELLMKEVIHRAHELAAMLDEHGRMKRPSISIADVYKMCRKCEYRFPEGKEKKPHGFAECWGDAAAARPHILDLHRVGQIGSAKFDDPVPVLLSKRQASLLDLREDQLGASGAYTNRRRLQWENSTNGGNEHLPGALRQELADYRVSPGYPFHFVDFEACDVVLPHHAGLGPYERVAFQWSCHTLDEKGELNHREWLNTERQFPNFKFAKELRGCLGEDGAVFVWSPYEQTTLRMILEQIDAWITTAPQEALLASGFQSLAELRELADWIDRLLGPPDAKSKRAHSPRIRDLHKLVVQHYFHPLMLGRTSIKVVLPAVWNQSQTLRRHPWFEEYHQTDESGALIDPYKTLEPLPLGEEEDDEDVVREGTGAIRIYQELIFWEGSDEQHRKNRETLLKQYCKLDTAAMVMIWAHWTGHTEAANQQINP